MLREVYTCPDCSGIDVHVHVPAWLDANGASKEDRDNLVEIDWEGPRQYFCVSCQEYISPVMQKMRRGTVVWETDGEDLDLPTEVWIPDNLKNREVADLLSDTYGWLVADWWYR